MPDGYTRTTTVVLTEGERAEMVPMAGSRSLPAALALRARIVLACEGQDKASTDVAQAWSYAAGQAGFGSRQDSNNCRPASSAAKPPGTAPNGASSASKDCRKVSRMVSTICLPCVVRPIR